MSVAGVLVKPKAISDSTADSSCQNVPSGYLPLTGLTVTFKNDAGDVVGTLTTDDCGNFRGNVPQSAAIAAATPADLNPIERPVTAFITLTADGAATLASTAPTGATYAISVVQDLGNGKIALTVTDTNTGKAVLGLTAADFSFAIGGSALGLASLNYGAVTSQSASVAMVMDASGSMDLLVGSSGKAAIQIAAKAGHVLLDGLNSGSDEAGIVIFDDKITKMNDAALAQWRWTNNGTTSSPYQFSTSGLTSDIAKLRPVVDSYDYYSQIYSNSLFPLDPVNAGTGAWRITSYYPWYNNTALYSATKTGIDMLDQASNARRIVVAMTDGMDNASSITSTAAIAAANAKGIPLYMVAFGSQGNVNESVMQQMADQTGGEYKRVEGDDLTGLFQGIQTGIRFQYVANLSTAPTSGSTVTIGVQQGNNSAANRTLVIR